MRAAVRFTRGFVLRLALYCVCVVCTAQSVPSPDQMRALADAQRWEELARILPPMQARSADANFYYGEALAQMGRMPEAEQAFQAGWKQAPRDARFPTELAGIAFKQKRNAQAEHLLRNALKLSPQDAYRNDFLGTLYFLDGNVEAALKYWNRAGKPEIADVGSDPRPRIASVLLDRAFVFAPASRMRLSQYLDTESRLRGLGVFPQFQVDLNSRADGRFNAVLRARERDGLGGGAWEDLFLFSRGIPFQQVSPSYYNLGGEAINFDSMVRWDAQKRRVWASFSGPMERGAKYRWELNADLRDENWAIRNSFTGPGPVLANFNLRTARGSAGVASYARDRLTWRAGVEISHRDLRVTSPGAMLTTQMLANGYALKQRAEATAVLWRVPERRFTLRAGGSNDVTRLWSESPTAFDKLEGWANWHWFPRARGDDYGAAQTIRAGEVFGQPPFDELYMLGLERDNDLPMRAHIGTREGRKGSAPLGSRYFVENWEQDKKLYSNGLVDLKLGPFFDAGRISDPGTQLSSGRWLFDTGAQIKVRMLGSGLVFSYGRDLRTGNNAFYLRLLEQ